MSHNCKFYLNIDKQTVSEENTLRSWGPFNTVDKVDVGTYARIENTH